MIGLGRLGVGLARNVVGGFRASLSVVVAEDFTTAVVGTINFSGNEGPVTLVPNTAITNQAGDNGGLFSVTTGLEVTFDPQALGAALTTDRDQTVTSYTVQLTDGTTTIDVPIRVTIRNTDEAPVAAGNLADRTFTLNSAITGFSVANDFTDADDTLTFTASGLPAGLSMDTSGNVSGTPTALVTGQVVTITATDGGNQTATSGFQITVGAGASAQAISVTQAEFDALTPTSGQLYVVDEIGGNTTLTGGIIALSRTDYEALTPDASTLYVVDDTLGSPTTITDVQRVARAALGTPTETTFTQVT